MSCFFRIAAFACLIAGGSTCFLARMTARQRIEKQVQLEATQSRLESKQTQRAELRELLPARLAEAQAAISAAENHLLETRKQLREEMDQLEKLGLTKAEIAILAEQPPDQAADYVANKVLRWLPFDDRLANGHILRDHFSRNPSLGGALTVRNAMSADTAVKLSSEGGEQFFFYLRGGQSHTVTGLAEGRYQLAFAQGFDWDSSRERFARGRSAHVWTDSLDLGATENETLSITLPKDAFKTEKMRPLSDEEFRN